MMLVIDLREKQEKTYERYTQLQLRPLFQSNKGVFAATEVADNGKPHLLPERDIGIISITDSVDEFDPSDDLQLSSRVRTRRV